MKLKKKICKLFQCWHIISIKTNLRRSELFKLTCTLINLSRTLAFVALARSEMNRDVSETVYLQKYFKCVLIDIRTVIFKQLPCIQYHYNFCKCKPYYKPSMGKKVKKSKIEISENKLRNMRTIKIKVKISMTMRNQIKK